MPEKIDECFFCKSIEEIYVNVLKHTRVETKPLHKMSYKEAEIEYKDYRYVLVSAL